MDASNDGSPMVRINPGCFSRARVENEAGEVELRLSRYGNWMVHIRAAGESSWRIACSGDMESGVLASESVRRDLDTFVFGPLVVHRSGPVAGTGSPSSTSVSRRRWRERPWV